MKDTEGVPTETEVTWFFKGSCGWQTGTWDCPINRFWQRWRGVQKNCTYTWWKKTWPNSNSCTRELGRGSITAAQNVALIRWLPWERRQQLPSPLANQTMTGVLHWVVRAASGGKSSKWMWLWKVCGGCRWDQLPTLFSLACIYHRGWKT